MDFNELFKEIDEKMQEIGSEYIKDQIIEQSKELPCQECGEKAYSVQGFSQNGNIIIGHLKCGNCGFEGDFTGQYQLDTEDAKNEIKTGITKLENTIDECNRTLNKK